MSTIFWVCSHQHVNNAGTDPKIGIWAPIMVLKMSALDWRQAAALRHAAMVYGVVYAVIGQVAQQDA